MIAGKLANELGAAALENQQTHFDVIIVGAGISGIGAACHLQKKSPNRSFAILEARADIGGTWDLFRYPGIRSDSDMYTLGYAFKPWKEGAAIADGDSILKYLNETVDENGLRNKIRFGRRVMKASWSSAQAGWTITITNSETGEDETLSCGYLFMCSGYYNYESGYLPEFEGYEDFKGTIAHPQHWPKNLDYTGKNVVVIGSGATAVTIVPAMAETANHVTMLQRSPSYIASRPQSDALANALRKFLPAWLAYKIVRVKNVLLTIAFFKLAKRYPGGIKKRLIQMVEQELGPDFDVKTHFTPKYNPWDQRLCAVPDADLFEAMRDKRASIVTDHIDHFTETGIALKSGSELNADIIVPATGLRLQSLGGMELVVDNEPVTVGETTNYKGFTLSNVPNFAWTIGYTNASWTLKADLTANYVCRLLNHMEKHGYSVCVPELKDGEIDAGPILDLSSGYIQRSIHEIPKQGGQQPWRIHHNYISDLLHLKFERLDDGVMQFS